MTSSVIWSVIKLSSLSHKVLKMTSRVSDIPCRFGGEEFCVILPDTDAEQAFIWAESICRSVRETKLDTSRGPLSITVSIGVATLPKETTSIQDTLEQADAGCLEAKDEDATKWLSPIHKIH